jgi:hypothetical protein
MSSPDRIAQARALILEVLSGQVTPESARYVFDDDLLYLAVGTLRREPAELAWLRDQLTQPHPGAALVRACLPPPA